MRAVGGNASGKGVTRGGGACWACRAGSCAPIEQLRLVLRQLCVVGKKGEGTVLGQRRWDEGRRLGGKKKRFGGGGRKRKEGRKEERERKEGRESGKGKERGEKRQKGKKKEPGESLSVQR
ncbi:predicted protein [Coccidioides posadasii str. Silveira]|uniref:Predicted protein n=1 Tax=Coccidioides posadasii (strain RMSCC 757 / Silveira) TaxID=443226 RepID=E9CTY8_COCPS|nr:predicted protein [Coccidioides posadasii str. Silveira]